MTTAQEQADLLAEIGGQNKATMGALLGTGSIAKATERADGTMEATIRIPEDAMAWEPAVLVLPHAGTVELTIINDDKNTGEPLEGPRDARTGRPRLLLVRLAGRQRRGQGTDRRHRRDRRSTAGSQARPTRPASAVER